jgi:hypothetical protein
MASFKPRRTTIEDPPLARLLFGSTSIAWLWLIIRGWLG